MTERSAHGSNNNRGADPLEKLRDQLTSHIEDLHEELATAERMLATLAREIEAVRS